MSGRRHHRFEDATLLTSARFIASVPLHDPVDLAFVRSPAACGRLVSIEAAPGTEIVLAEDLVGISPLIASVQGLDYHADVPIPLLGGPEVAYAGQPIAAVLASSRYEAEDIASGVDVEVQASEAAATTSGALERGPLPHLADTQHDNVLGRVSGGDWERTGARITESTIQLSQTFSHGRNVAFPIENRGTVAYPRVGGGVVVWSTTQVPGLLRNVLSEVLGLPREIVEIRVPPIGGAFGVKAYVYPEEVLVAFIALQRNRAVRWIEDRYEHLVSGTQAREGELVVEIGATANGTLNALRCTATSDAGAFPCFPWGATCELKWLPFLPGPYQVSEFAYSGVAVATNKVPLGIYRGVAQPFLVFAMERTMDVLAKATGRGRGQVREANLVETDFVSAGGFVHEQCSYIESVALAEEDIRRESVNLIGRLRPGESFGAGYAVFAEATGGPSTSRFPPKGLPIEEDLILRLTPSGRVNILCGLVPHGQGTHTTFAGVIEEETGLSATVIDWESNHTEVNGAGTWGSRSVVAFEEPVREIARAFRAELLNRASRILEIGGEDLLLDGNLLRSIDGAAEMSLETLAAMSPGIAVNSTFAPGKLVFSNACHIAYVGVDADAGTVRVLELTAIEDCGRHLQPEIVRGQIIGGMVQGLGEALYESIVYDDECQPQTTTLLDFSIPTVFEVPPIRLIDIPGSDLRSPKGVGESGVIGIPAAIGNAIADATSNHVNPIEPSAVPLDDFYPIEPW